MYITGFEITDVRCFAGTHKVLLDRGDGTYAGWTVFAGRNGAGKSTLLRALAMSVVGHLTAQSLERSFVGWVRQGVDISNGNIVSQIEIDRVLDSSRVPHMPLRLESAAVHLTIVLRPGEAVGASASGGTGHILGGEELLGWREQPIKGWFIAGYGPFRHLGPPDAGTAKVMKDPVLGRLINLFQESASLGEAVDWLKQVHLRALEGREGAAQLKTDALRLLGDGLLPDGSVVDGVDSDGLWVVRDGVRLPLESASDGYRTVAALVLDIARNLQICYGRLSLQEDRGQVVCPLPGVVLIDEVDAHLHVEWQQRIGFWLTEHFPKIQFLVTSHSPFVCQAASPRGLIRLPAPGEDRRIEHVDDRVFKTVTRGDVTSAVMTELFGLDRAHSPQVERWRQEIARLEGKLLKEGHLDDKELKEREDLLALLPDSLRDRAEIKLAGLMEALDAAD